MLTPTTKLEAINEILSAGGEDRVNSINTPEADEALAFLDQKSRALQTQGWWFNTTRNRTIHPDTDGYIAVPVNTLKVLPEHGRYMLRGNKIYDVYGDGYLHKEPVTVDIVEGLEWDELPEAAKTLIYLSAGRTYQDRLLGDPNTHAVQSAEELAAYQELLISNVNAMGANIFANQDIQRGMVRGATTRNLHVHTMERGLNGDY